MKITNFWARSASRHRRHSQGSLAGHGSAFRDARTATVAIALCLAACGGDDTDGSGASTTVDQADASATVADASATATATAADSTTTDTGLGPYECVCDDECASNGYLCEPVRPVGGVGPDKEDQAANEAAIDCVLVALRDRTPGSLRWSRAMEVSEESGEFQIRDDGTALYSYQNTELACIYFAPTLAGMLPAPGDYGACLGNPDLNARFDCIRNTELIGGPIECSEASEDCGFGDTTTGAEVVPGCECIVDEDDAAVEGNDTQPSQPTCGDALCAPVFGSFPKGGPDKGGGGFMLDDPAALECGLTALRDRTPGVISWGWSSNIGQFTNNGYVLITAEGTAVRRAWGDEDLNYIAGAAQLGELNTPEAFDACLIEPDDELRFDCMRMGIFASELAVCDEGWETVAEI